MQGMKDGLSSRSSDLPVHDCCTQRCMRTTTAHTHTHRSPQFESHVPAVHGARLLAAPLPRSVGAQHEEAVRCLAATQDCQVCHGLPGEVRLRSEGCT